MGLWQRLLRAWRRRDRFNLHIEPGYTVKASRHKPYFQALERRAREHGYLGDFVVDDQGRLRPGSRKGLETKHATLSLDVYPNPAAIEGRTVADYDHPDGPRRAARAMIVLDDDSELFVRRTPNGLAVQEPPPRFPR